MARKLNIGLDGCCALKLQIVNVGAFRIILSNENAASAANNRFTLPNGDVFLDPNTTLSLVYDSTSSRWRPESVQGIQSLAVATTGLQKRQCVLTGKVDTAGVPAFFADGSGGGVAKLNLVATATPLVLALAGGFNASGSIDYISRLTADAAADRRSEPGRAAVDSMVDRSGGGERFRRLCING